MARHDLQVYHFDRHEMDHIARADPVRHPQLYALQVRLKELTEQAWLDEYWVRRPVEQMTEIVARHFKPLLAGSPRHSGQW